MSPIRSPQRPLAQQPLYRTAKPRPFAWIKRRARRLERGFAIPRRAALLQASQDWKRFQPFSVQH